jgi:hypothetical protein
MRHSTAADQQTAMRLTGRVFSYTDRQQRASFLTFESSGLARQTPQGAPLLWWVQNSSLLLATNEASEGVRLEMQADGSWVGIAQCGERSDVALVPETGTLHS